MKPNTWRGLKDLGFPELLLEAFVLLRKTHLAAFASARNPKELAEPGSTPHSAD